jgi:hypothetical protein
MMLRCILLIGINAERLSAAYGGTVLRTADKSLYRKNAERFLVVLRYNVVYEYENGEWHEYENVVIRVCFCPNPQPL